jgi:DNA-binding response OmpR family regulator
MEARIVVIDNDEGIRHLFTVIFNHGGWQVFSYDYAHIDLVILQQLKPDLIILDFNIRENGAGWEFLRTLKMEDTTANIPILITTTLIRLSAEMQGYLLTRYIRVVNKPFDLDPFLLLVRHTLTLASWAGVISFRDRSSPILVVEDTEDLREALATVLRLEGYQVVTADNGLLALDAVSSTRQRK